MWATDALSRMSEIAAGSIEPEGESVIQMADIGTVALRLASMPSPMKARPVSWDSR